MSAPQFRRGAMAEIGLDDCGSAATCAGVPSAMMRPSASTNTRSASDITACITCSIIKMVMPRRHRFRMTGTMSRISDGLSPANTSSSNNNFGLGRERARKLEPLPPGDRQGIRGTVQHVA